MLDNWRKARKEAEEMNLLPVMNLMVILIPALMLGAAFYHLGTIATSIPDNVPASDQKPPKDVKVTMSIEILPDRLSVSGSGDGLAKEQISRLDLTLMGGFGQRPLDKLTAHLHKIKLEYPKSDTVMIVPDAKTRYADVVSVLDASRERKLPPDQAAEGKEFEPLFPVSSLTKRNLAEPDAEDGAGTDGGGDE
ncbi:MAG: biopolymer transporter ExbD [Myxococcota bacterium]|nr:biopolymer transporter ExbD [Myxococcota bacterium]